MKFHIGDVISVTTGVLVSNEGIDGVQKIVSYLCGREIFTHEIPRACDLCEPKIAEEFNGLSKENLQEDISKLTKMLIDCDTYKEKKVVVEEWNGLMEDKFREFVELKPIQDALEYFNKTNPINSLIGMMNQRDKK